jgi:hypothetical protein
LARVALRNGFERVNVVTGGVLQQLGRLNTLNPRFTLLPLSESF